MAEREDQEQYRSFHEPDHRGEKIVVQPPDPDPVQRNEQDDEGNAGIGQEKPEEDRGHIGGYERHMVQVTAMQFGGIVHDKPGVGCRRREKD